MNLGPNVNEAGASSGDATEYVTYAGDETSYVARSLFSFNSCLLFRIMSNSLRGPANSNRRPCPRQFFEVLQTLIRASDVQEI